MGKYVDNQIEKLNKSKNISKENKEHIIVFVKKCYAQGLSERRITKLIWVLRTLASMIDFDFEKATKEQIEELVARINQSDWKSWTKSDYKKIIKKFYKVLFSEDGLEIPKLVRWIDTRVEDKYQEKKRLQGMIEPEHIEKMINKAPNTMYKAMIRFLFETGARISEVIGDSEYPETGIKVRDIKWDGDMVDVILTGKTGTREISVYDSVPLLTAWYQQHPCKENGDAFLFTGKLSGDRLSPQTVSQTLKRVKENTGLNGVDVNPHAFRRASITYYSDFLVPIQISQKYGLAPDSKVLRHYLYRKPGQLKQAIRKMHGLSDVENDNKTKPHDCPRCKELLDSSAKQCINCGLILSAGDRIDRRKKEAVSNWVMNKVMEANPSLESQIKDISKKFESDIRDMLK